MNRGVIVVLAWIAGCAQGGFVEPERPASELIPVEGAPLGYEGAGLAFDSARGRMVLFGGKYGESMPVFSAEIFELIGGNWVKQDAAGPAARAFHAIGFDARRAKIFVFGGRGADGCLGDSWVWEGAAWSRVETAIAPEPRSGAVMSWDSRREELLLAGGTGCEAGAGNYRDLWSFDGSAWTRRWP